MLVRWPGGEERPIEVLDRLASEFARAFDDAEGYAWTVGETKVDWAQMIAKKDRELDRLNGIYLNLLKNSNVQLFEGRAKLIDAHTVEVAGKRVTSETIMIATGGHAQRPPIPGIELTMTSDDILDMKEIPKHLVVVGEVLRQPGRNGQQAGRLRCERPQ